MTNKIKYNILNSINQIGGDESDIVNSRISSLLESPDYKKGYQQAVYDIEFYHKREEVPASKEEVPTTKDEISSKEEVPTTKEEISSKEEVPITKEEISSKEEVPITKKKVSNKINPYPQLRLQTTPNYTSNQLYTHTHPFNVGNYYNNIQQPMPYYEYLPQSDLYNSNYVNNLYGGRLNEKKFYKKNRKIYYINYNK